MAKSKTETPRKPTRPTAPDIQALAKMDRILSELNPLQARITLRFLEAKYFVANETNVDLSPGENPNAP